MHLRVCDVHVDGCEQKPKGLKLKSRTCYSIVLELRTVFVGA